MKLEKAKRLKSGDKVRFTPNNEVGRSEELEIKRISFLDEDDEEDPIVLITTTSDEQIEVWINEIERI